MGLLVTHVIFPYSIRTLSYSGEGVIENCVPEYRLTTRMMALLNRIMAILNYLTPTVRNHSRHILMTPQPVSTFTEFSNLTDSSSPLLPICW